MMKDVQVLSLIQVLRKKRMKLKIWKIPKQQTKKRWMKMKELEENKKTETKEGNEKNIKQSILKIIENAKSIDQKRAVRNYGRTFEFQNVQLKPTVPNDRRPAKAKRMDNMWTQTLAKKQGVQINHLPTTPKPKVPR